MKITNLTGLRKSLATSLSLLALSIASAESGAAAPPAHLPDLVPEVSVKSVRLLAPTGHHFNIKAPVEALTEGKPVFLKLSKQHLELRPGKLGRDTAVDLSVFICDDANTFCLKKKQTVVLPAGQYPEGAATAKPSSPSQHGQDPKTGFWINEPERALQLAAQQKKPLLIDFFGIWCPPCNHLDAMVFGSKEFRAQIAPKFVLLKLDADNPASRELKEKYQIQGLPTVILATPQGDEITRIIGYRERDEILRTARAAAENRDQGFAAWIEKAKQGDFEGTLKAARIALDREEPQRAMDWLSSVKDELKQRKDARLEWFYEAWAATEASAEGKQKALRAWVQDFPGTMGSIDAYGRLAELTASNEYLEKGLASVNALISHPETRTNTEYTEADLKQSKAEILGKLGREAESKAAYLEAAGAYEQEAVQEASQNKTAKGSFARGPQLERAYCLAQGGKLNEAEKIYREGVRRFPTEYTYHAGLAKFLLDHRKDAVGAEKEAKEALKYAYGGQRLRAAWTQVRALENAGRLRDAIETIGRETAAQGADGAYASWKRLLERFSVKKAELEKKLGGSI